MLWVDFDCHTEIAAKELFVGELDELIALLTDIATAEDKDQEVYQAMCKGIQGLLAIRHARHLRDQEASK